MSPSVHGDSSTRRRTTRACDQCRKTKSRCEHPPHSQEPCRNCLLSASTCTFLEPSHKRGPPKGYLSALEQRLHDAEALLGVIISSSDPRATTMVADLSKDSLAASIIARVANTSFGPVGRNALRHRDCNSNSRRRSIDLRQQQMNEHEAPLIDGNGHLVFTTPSNTWQDYLNLRLSLESGLRSQAHSKPFSQNPTSDQPLQSCPLPEVSAPKPLNLQTSFQFPISSAVGPAHQMDADACDINSPPSTSSSQTAMCHETPEGDESDDSTSLSNHQNQSTLAGDLNSQALAQAPNRQKDFDRASYNHLAHTFGLDAAFVSILDPPFDAQQIPASAMDAGKPRVVTRGHWAAKSEEADADSWTRLVVEGSDPPPTLFNASSTGLDLPDLNSCTPLRTPLRN